MKGFFCVFNIFYYLIFKKVNIGNKKSEKFKNKIAKHFKFVYNGEYGKAAFVWKCCFAAKRVRQGDVI